MSFHFLCLCSPRPRLPYAPSVASSRIPAKSIVALVVGLGSTSVEMPVTQILITHGSKARRLVNVSLLGRQLSACADQMDVDLAKYLDLLHYPMSNRQPQCPRRSPPQRQSVLYAPSVASSKNPASSVVALLVGLGSTSVEIQATQSLTTHGSKATRLANVSLLGNLV